MKQTKVIFRIDKDNEILAIFPEIPFDRGYSNCMSYQHTGQHGCCSLDYVRNDTKPININDKMTAKNRLNQYQLDQLINELTNDVGYDLNIRCRMSDKMNQIRIDEIKRFCTA